MFDLCLHPSLYIMLRAWYYSDKQCSLTMLTNKPLRKKKRPDSTVVEPPVKFQSDQLTWITLNP